MFQYCYYHLFYFWSGVSFKVINTRLCHHLLQAKYVVEMERTASTLFVLKANQQLMASISFGIDVFITCQCRYDYYRLSDLYDNLAIWLESLVSQHVVEWLSLNVASTIPFQVIASDFNSYSNPDINDYGAAISVQIVLLPETEFSSNYLCFSYHQLWLSTEELLNQALPNFLSDNGLSFSLFRVRGTVVTMGLWDA